MLSEEQVMLHEFPALSVTVKGVVEEQDESEAVEAPVELLAGAAADDDDGTSTTLDEVGTGEEAAALLDGTLDDEVGMAAFEDGTEDDEDAPSPG